MFAPAVVPLLFGISMAPKWGWDSSGVWAFILTGAVVLAFWAWYESRHSEPLVDVKLLRKPRIAVGNLCTCLAGMTCNQLPFITLMILQQPVLAGVGLGVSATMAGLLKIPSNIANLASSPFSGFVATRRGPVIATLLGALIHVCGWMLLFFFHDTLWQVVTGSITVSVGSSMLISVIPSLVMEDAPRDRSSEVTGLVQVNRGLFTAIGAQVMATLLATSRLIDPASGATYPSGQAYQLAFGAAVLFAAAIPALLGLLLLRRPAPAAA